MVKIDMCENYYEIITHIIFRLTGDSVFIFELKMDKGEETEKVLNSALFQIDDKGYADRFAVSGKQMLKVGVVFFQRRQRLTRLESENKLTESDSLLFAFFHSLLFHHTHPPLLHQKTHKKNFQVSLFDTLPGLFCHCKQTNANAPMDVKRK